jgi:hypothetical protein
MAHIGLRQVFQHPIGPLLSLAEQDKRLRAFNQAQRRAHSSVQPSAAFKKEFNIFGRREVRPELNERLKGGFGTGGGGGRSAPAPSANQSAAGAVVVNRQTARRGSPALATNVPPQTVRNRASTFNLDRFLNQRRG